ncbi:hypothetical protein BDY19DRAFT_887690 [Irpex rosettiformis]|uniref:Uncharacterized protein n=1 Tax=Irpex rosettiformis TaxID=378272 RepID=A0ACB8U858_9APHY|nr:hypothetical protein BDY19DRAFT_887690 [Irpex rosettiformis]
MLRYLPLFFLPSLAAAYSFNIDNTPRQCQNLTISITGSGQPPYNLLVIPFGPTPLSTSKEVRRIIQRNFTENSVTFPLNYPVSSQFIVQLSDTSGFGSGGATAAVTVLNSTDSSCYDPNTGVQPGFYYSLVPNSLQQCSPTRFWWDPSPSAGVEGTPFFVGVIPGGQSLQVPQGTITQVADQGTGYSWSPFVRAGTTLVIVAGDNRGLGSGGSSTYFINNGDNSTCLNSTSPSSTAGSPAGGSYPTSTSGAGTDNGSSSHHTNTGAIVGGVVGGVVGLTALILLGIFLWRRHRFHQQQEKRPVDLLNEDDAPDGNPPQYYEPEPFVVPEPTVGTSSAAETSTVAGAPRPSVDHRQSHYSNLTGERSATPDQSAVSGSTYFRKSPAPPSFRPVNIIQHDDAGPSEAVPETIELPPAYTNLRAGPKSADEEGESSASAPTAPDVQTQAEQAA